MPDFDPCRCRVCGCPETCKLWVVAGDQWYRCYECGSDTNSRDPATVAGLYNDAYVGHNLDQAGGDFETLKLQLQTNVSLFESHLPGSEKYNLDRSFLDIGCLEGAGMSAMQDAGWAVHGFDVIPSVRTGDHITIAPHFKSTLFPRRYAAVMCREVIEHIDTWATLITEAYSVTAVGGLFQLQTPRPWPEPESIPYQPAHLQLFNPAVLGIWLERTGFDVLDFRTWPMGQLWMCRRVQE